MYVVTVKFFVVPEHLSAFKQAILKQADDSLSLEQNCLQFDVCYSEQSNSLIYLYEIYKTKKDFEAHLASEHFTNFSTKIATMVLDKQVECFETIHCLHDSK